MERAPSLKSAGDERTSREPTPTSSRGDGKDRLKPSRPPCRFFLLGKCKFGDACTFSHDGRIPICTFFEQKGSCRYGNSCKFLHNSPGAGSAESSVGKARGGESVGALGSTVSTPAVSGAGAATTASNQAAPPPDAGECCGICLENIPSAGKRFGLLNCDHVFCVDCLRKWRKSRGPQKDISRTCPECRKVSFFVVPSKEHLKGKAKLKAIQAYKKGLSKLPCKYHKVDGSTVCPFGAGCFYAHFDENGVDVKSRSPPAQPVPRRTCPYLRNRGRGGGGGGGGGGGSSSSTGGGAAEMGGRGAGSWDLEDFPDSFSIEDEVILHDIDGDHISFIMRLQQLMMLADEL